MAHPVASRVSFPQTLTCSKALGVSPACAASLRLVPLNAAPALRLHPGRLVAYSQRRNISVLSSVSEDEGAVSSGFDIHILEAYTDKVKGEVLRVHAMIEDDEDEVIIYKGFSSSLMRPTTNDPSEPLLPASALITSIDRIKGPFNPANVELLEEGLLWEEFADVLRKNGLLPSSSSSPERTSAQASVTEGVEEEFVEEEELVDEGAWEDEEWDEEELDELFDKFGETVVSRDDDESASTRSTTLSGNGSPVASLVDESSRAVESASNSATVPVDAETLAVAMASAANDGKGGEVVVLKVKTLVYWTEYFVIISAFSRPQVEAIRKRLRDAAEEQFGRKTKEGIKEAPSGWTLIDFGDVVVHIFMPKEREFYNLEQFYGNAESIPLPFETRSFY